REEGHAEAQAVAVSRSGSPRLRFRVDTHRVLPLPRHMIRKAVLALPLALVLGCGAAPPPAAAPPASEPPPAGAAAAPGAAPATPPAPPPAASPAPAESPPVGRATASTDAPIATGITQDDIFQQVQKHGEIFSKCYTLGAGSNKSWTAKVTVKATVGPTGI